MAGPIDINCDMGEGFGSWEFGDGVDAQVMPMVSSINVAAGFHAGDPSTIARTLRCAREHDVGVGVHPGFRDLVGFGRRHISATAEELVHDSMYQLGAVRELVRLHGLSLQHFKLHGALYMHAARDEEFASAMVDALQVVSPDLPVLTMSGTVLEQVALDRGQPVVLEFYADRAYGADGQIVFTRDVGALQPDRVAAKVLQACQQGTVRTVDGDTISVTFDSVCIHSDTRGAYDLLRATRDALDGAQVPVRSFAAATG